MDATRNIDTLLLDHGHRLVEQPPNLAILSVATNMLNGSIAFAAIAALLYSCNQDAVAGQFLVSAAALGAQSTAIMGFCKWIPNTPLT